MTYTLTHELRPPAPGGQLDDLNRGLGALCDRPPLPDPVQVIEIEGLDLDEIECSMRLVTACEITSTG